MPDIRSNEPNQPNQPDQPNQPGQPNPPVQPGGPNPPGSQANGNQRIQALQELGQPSLPPRMDPDIHVLTVIGQVEGHVLLPAKNKTTKYEHVIPQLVAVEQSPTIKGLLVILNTVGGDIEAGLAIAEMIRSLSKPTVSLVLGGGHSIGMPIAVSAHRSLIASTATITVHPIRLTGLVIGVPQTYDYLDKMQDRVIRFVVENSHITEQHLRELMFRTGELVRDVGTVLIGPEAVQAGLIDQVGGLADAYHHLRAVIDARSEGVKPQPAPPFAPHAMPVPPVGPGYGGVPSNSGYRVPYGPPGGMER